LEELGIEDIYVNQKLRKENRGQNFSILNNATHDLPKIDKTNKMSFQDQRPKAIWSRHRIIYILNPIKV